MLRFFLMTGLLLTGCSARPTISNPHAASDLMQCQSNLRNLGTGIMLYANDHGGKAPERLEQLTRGEKPYFQSLPTCPAAQADSYSRSYKVERQASGKDSFRFCCQGKHHQAARRGPDLPMYTSEMGLVEFTDESPPGR